MCAMCLVAQLCLTLCDYMDCSPPGSSVHADSPGKNTGVGCHVLFQGIFPTQRSNPVSHITSGFFTVWGTREAQEYWSGQPMPSPQIFPAQELNWGLLHCRWILYQLKNLPTNTGDTNLIPGSGRFSQEGNSNSLQCSCLGNFMDRRAWRATVHEVAKKPDTA